MRCNPAVTIGTAIIWAAVILASAMILKDTPQWGQMLPILGGGAAASIIISSRVPKERG